MPPSAHLVYTTEFQFHQESQHPSPLQVKKTLDHREAQPAKQHWKEVLRTEFNMPIEARDGGIFQIDWAKKTEGLLGCVISKRQRTCGSET